MSFNGSDPARKTGPRGQSLIEKYATASAADFIREARRQGVRFASPPPAHLLRQPKPPPAGSSHVTADRSAQTTENTMSTEIPTEKRDRLQELLQQHVSVGDAAARVEVPAGQAMKVRDQLRALGVPCNCGKDLGHTGRCQGKQGTRKATSRRKRLSKSSASKAPAVKKTASVAVPTDVVHQVQQHVEAWAARFEELLGELQKHAEKAPVPIEVSVNVVQR